MMVEESGIAILKKKVKSEHPSTLEASSSSSGTPASKKERQTIRL